VPAGTRANQRHGNAHFLTKGRLGKRWILQKTAEEMARLRGSDEIKVISPELARANYPPSLYAVRSYRRDHTGQIIIYEEEQAINREEKN